VAVGTFTGLVARMDQFARWNALLEKVAGVMIILVGGYFAWIA
jgi:cytochrome c-type biogenesis protein